jgi:superfamily II DNA helicase RecQ
MKSTREKIFNALNMRSPEFIMVSPERSNISYAVVKMSNQVNVIGTLTGYFVCLNPTVSR